MEGDVSEINEIIEFCSDLDENNVASKKSLSSASGKPASKKRACVWRFFCFDNEKKISKCAVNLTKCKYSGKGRHTWTLLSHLRFHHPEEYAVVSELKMECAKTAKLADNLANAEQQKKINGLFPVTSAAKYSSDNAKQKQLDQSFAIFVGSTTFAYHLTENCEFREFLEQLDPHYKIPSQKKLKDQVDRIVVNLKKTIKAMITVCPDGSIAICLDIWSQKSMVASYLAITAHFYSLKLQKLVRVCLAVKSLYGSHTAALVRMETKLVLDEYGICKSQISRIKSDNGSNMVAAFRDSVVQLSASVPEFFTEIDDEIVDATVYLSAVDNNLDESFCDEESEYERNLVEFKRVFPKWLECVAHSLQLPLRKVIDANKELKNLREKVFGLISKFSRSATGTARLVELSGKKLILPGPTQWNTICITYRRLLELRHFVDQVCLELNWSTIGESYAQIEYVSELLQPFLNFTDFLQGDEYITLSAVIPTLMEILMHLENPLPSTKWVSLGTIAPDLASEIRSRFSHILGWQNDNTKFDATYLVSTFIDPNVSYLLSNHGQQLAAWELLIMIRGGSLEQSSSATDSANQHTLESQRATTSLTEIPPGRFARLAAVVSSQREQKCANKPPKDDDMEIKEYIKCHARQVPLSETDAIAFWMVNRKKFPTMSKVALNLLPIPATSASVERVFSQAGLCTLGHKNRTGSKLLENECLLKFNKKYLRM